MRAENRLGGKADITQKGVVGYGEQEKRYYKDY